MKRHTFSRIIVAWGAALLLATQATAAGATEMTPKKEAVKITQTAGRDALGDFAPDFARYNDDILFGEVWSKNDVLPLRERSIVTVSALVASGVIDSSLRYHIESAKKNGVTKEEMVEAITQLGFYAGWPKAWAAFRMAKEVYAAPAADTQSATPAVENAVEIKTEKIPGYQAPDSITIAGLNEKGPFPAGAENTAYAQYFVGKSYLLPLSTSQTPLFAVSFEPGCRNNWHTHKAEKGGGQVLIATAGRGYYQIWGQAPVEMRPGDVVHIPANVKHWHGAAPDTAFQHLAIEVPGEGTSAVWEEPVDPAEYAKLK